jgi:hypothetical protein
MKKISLGVKLLALGLFLCSAECDNIDPVDPVDPNGIPVTGITINGEASVAVGQATTFTVSITPGNATNKEVTWTSLQSSIATVNANGVVTGVSQGTATIRATAKDGSGITATKSVTVTAPAAVIDLTNAMINASANVSLAPGTYQVKSDLTLNGGNNLTISPGTVIRFDKDRRFIVQLNAKIIAKGTAAQPITFTSNLQTPAAGDWQGIYLYGTNNEFDRCVFEYGGGQTSGWGMLYFDNATASITYCTFRNAKYNGIYLYNSGSRFNKFENNTMTNCGETEAESYPIKVGTGADLSCLGVMGNNTITTAKGIGVSGTTLTRSVTIKAFVPYLFYGEVTVNNGAIMTIEAGSRLKFDSNRGIILNGGAKIIANGTSTAQITFTSSRATPAAGDWNGIKIYSNASDFKYCTFEYGGSQDDWGMLYLDNSKASFTNSIFRHAKYNGIYLYNGNSGFTAFDNNSMTNCGETEANMYPIKAGTGAGIMSLSVMGDNNTITSAKGIGIRSSTVNGNITLKNYRYTVFGDITVSQSGAGATLTILPGATLMFTQGTQLHIAAGGKLIAQGTSANRITFTGTVQDRGWWHGIRFTTNNALSGSTISYCTVSYGGRGTNNWDNGNISCYEIATGKLSISNTTLTHSRAWGLFIWTNAFPTVTDATMSYSNNGQFNTSNKGITVIGNY